ncbi:MAG: energy-coupling factor ABC transporter permease [Thermoleophilia bacterium]
MHIMEGYLPAAECAAWYAASLPLWAVAVRKTQRLVQEHRDTLLLLGMAAGFCFVLSALKMPSVTGSSSHPTGMGLGAVLFGPWPMVLVGSIVLLFQALLLAHGGITTLGANSFSMAVVGAFAAWIVFKVGRRLGWSIPVAGFFAAAIGNLLTYCTTATQLAIAYPDQISGFWGSWVKFMGVFAVTQIPLAIAEGLLTSLVLIYLTKYQYNEMNNLGMLKVKVQPS